MSRVIRVLGAHALSSVGMSLPWPLLLVLVWDATGSSLWLGVAAATRMLPYVLFSWWLPRVADRFERDRVVRRSIAARLVLLSGVAAMVHAGQVGWAVAFAALAVVAATPAYPALAAGMPALAGPSSGRATELLVTIEVSSFVVGPALGGLLLHHRPTMLLLPVVLTGAAAVMYSGVRQPRPSLRSGAPRVPVLGLLVALGPLRRGVVAVILVNLVIAGVQVALLPFADQRWDGETSFGIATGILGLGSLAGPLLTRVGRGAPTRIWSGTALVAAGIGALALTPTVWWAAGPLALAGAAAVHVETAATETIQEGVPDQQRAELLGVTDTAMVAAALVGSLVAPVLATALGGATLLAATTLVTAGIAWRWAATPPDRPAHRGKRTPLAVGSLQGRP
ncbi:MAG: MFS transporter [Nocardioidaceae bacterium]